MGAAIVGLGHHLPPEVERGGVRHPIAVDAVGPSQLAATAAAAALERAHLSATALDFIVFATMTPDVTFPGAGCYFQDQLSCGTIGALDIRAQCAGFVFGLVIADRFVTAGVYQHVLVAGAEVHSSGLDYSERGAALAGLYGDGAGVALLGHGDGTHGIRGAAMHTDGRQHREFWCEYPSSRQHPVRMTVEDFRQGKHFPSLNADVVRQFGTESLPAVIDEALRAADLRRDDIDHYIISHVFPDVAETAAQRLGVPAARLTNPALRYGHLTAAALPVALSDDVQSGRVGTGANVCLAACGAGFAWGAVVVTL